MHLISGSAAFCVLTLSIALLQPAQAETGNEKFDVAGLTLGMTKEEVTQKLKEFGIASESIHETMLSYRYSDGINHDYKTDDFIYRISAANNALYQDGKKASDSFMLYFSPPPKGGRLVGLQRLMLNNINPVTGNEFKQAITNKYGEPTHANSGSLNWKFGTGDKNCLSTRPDGIGVMLPDNSRNKTILDMVYRKRSGQYKLDMFLVSRISNLAECASMLEFQLTSSADRPANSVTTTMIDVQSWIKAELAAGEEVEKLRQAAVEKRQAKGKTPSL